MDFNSLHTKQLVKNTRKENPCVMMKTISLEIDVM